MNKFDASSAKLSRHSIGSQKPLIVLYVAAVFLYWISLYLYVPTLPLYAKNKTDNLALLGVILSMYGLWQAIIRLPLGITADWLGWRKPFIIIGFALAGLGAYLMGAADGANELILGRSLTGLAAGTWVPLVVVFSSFFPPSEAVRASALLTLSGSAGRMLATSLTGWLNEQWGYQLAFLLAAAAATLSVIIISPIHEERHPPRRPSARGISQLIVRRDVLLPSLLSAVSQYANWGVTFGFLAILARQLGASDIVQSVLVAMNLGLVTIGNLAATAIVRRIGAKRLVYASFLLMALGIGVAALAFSLPMVFLVQFCMGLSQGIGYPMLMGMSIEHVAEAERTTAMGLHQAVYAIGMFSGPWLSGILADTIGLQPMFGVTMFACLVLGLLGAGKLTSVEK